MEIFRKINIIRGNIMRALTRNIGRTSNSAIPVSQIGGIKRILISRPNDRLGNLLLITPLLQEIIETFPGCEVDLFVRGNLAPIVFSNYPNVRHIIKLPKKPFKSLPKYIWAWLSLTKRRYDLVINVVKNSSSGRLSTMFVSSKYRFFGDDAEGAQVQYRDYRHIAKYPVYNFRDHLIGFAKKDTQAPPLNLKLNVEEIARGKRLLEKSIDTTKPTIALFTYATGHKRYPKAWWETFHTRLQHEFPAFNIIEVLPVENVSQLDFKIPSFYSRDIRELGAFIANIELFVGADSGVMHLAASVQTPTIGLFSVTDLDTYQPYGNNSIGINTTETTIDEWMSIIHLVLKKSHCPQEVEV